MCLQVNLTIWVSLVKRRIEIRNSRLDWGRKIVAALFLPVVLVGSPIVFSACSLLDGSGSSNMEEPPPDDNPPLDDTVLPDVPQPYEEPGIMVYEVVTGHNESHIEYAPYGSVGEALVVSPEIGSFIEPRISPDRSMVLYLGIDGVDHNYGAYLTEVPTGLSRPLTEKAGWGSPLFPDMDGLIWDTSNGGFYYTGKEEISGTISLWHYSISDSSNNLLNPSSLVASTLVTSDSLIAKNFDDHYEFTGFVFLDESGQKIGNIEIDSLNALFADSEAIGGAYRPSWNPVRRLLAFEVRDFVQRTQRIAVADLSNQFFRFVPDQPDVYMYARPRWGPNGELIFERTVHDDHHFQEGSLLIYDVDNGSLSVFISPQMIAGAEGIRFFDYAR